MSVAGVHSGNAQLSFRRTPSGRRTPRTPKNFTDALTDRAIGAMDRTVFPGLRTVVDQQEFIVTIMCYLLNWKRQGNVEQNIIFESITLALFAVWCLIEPFRLYLGYVGNLKEKVPQLTTFCLLSSLPQFIVTLYFAFAAPARMPFERASGWILFVFTGAGLVKGIAVVRRLIRHQTDQFYLNNDFDDEATSSDLSSNEDSGL